ncbi:MULTISPECIES: phosphotransferase [Alteromonadaceae]|uniref:Phosphotransferase n=1 Tax=Brumicola blandensis TaxID=3075611 RepID=A0AAW8R0G7_9ALTE|nr:MULTISPECIES: phosphotransferase [unclassified Alteromonas]MDT0582918.1 phosphotransferase [Alteromonas sp. W409]MDT0628334.1 phosphotransferase [Alteromonas sp. W364]
MKKGKEELLTLLSEPLGLSDDALLYPLSGGAINHSFYLNDEKNEFLVKCFEGEEATNIDRLERFELQAHLAKKKVAPAPLYICPDNGIYVEQWIKQHRSQIPLFFDELHVNALVKSMSLIHKINVNTRVIDLPAEWRNYLESIPSPSSFVIEQVAAVTEKWNKQANEQSSSWVFCHNDLVWAHLCPPTKIILDWEYAGIGNRYFDLLSCAKVNNFNSEQHDLLLSAYAKYNEIAIDDVYQECAIQSEYLQLTYQLWYDAVGLQPKK